MLNVKLSSREVVASEDDHIHIINSPSDVNNVTSDESESNYLKTQLLSDSKLVILNNYSRYIYVVIADEIDAESLRKIGHGIYTDLKKNKTDSIGLKSTGVEDTPALLLLEGLLLSAYQFNEYKSKASDYTLKEVIFADNISPTSVERLKNLTSSVFLSRDLVNHPSNFLTAQQLSEEIKSLADKFNVEVFGIEKIKSLKMEGLISVNLGSTTDPTFNIIEYKPVGAKNKRPLVLVGKGVVYDTGGLSLKPTEGSMDMMKCDMAGAATVIGTINALANNSIPVHVVGLIPATDNRPGVDAIAPGDIITMMNGKTVEIMNTDAEGRLILADALVYAQKYDPELVIDIATLTGSAIRAIGSKAAVMMGTADDKTKENLKQSGFSSHERLAELPFWEDYGEQIKSKTADIKNIGGAEAGAITAGKFLEHFIDYDWIHLDIAGPAYLNSADNYRGQYGTGFGVRLLYDFFVNRIKDGQEE